MGRGAAYGLGGVPTGADEFAFPMATWKTAQGGWNPLGIAVEAGENARGSGMEMAQGAGMTALAAFTGLHTGGLSGMFGSLALDALAMGAAYRNIHMPKGHFNPEGSMMSFNAMKRIGGAFIGGSLAGNALGSIVPGVGHLAGYALGSAMGAGPISFLKRHPILSLGSVAVYAAYKGARVAAKGTATFFEAAYRNRRAREGIDTAGDMSSFMTRSAFTQRQRAVQAIHKSHLNARSALGHEASYMHFPQKNYHSRYRRT